MRRTTVVALAVVVVLLLCLVGYFTSRSMNPGVDQFSTRLAEREVAEAALMTGEGLARQRILPRRFFVLIPAVRVVDVRRSPGNCTEYPSGTVPNSDYVAVVDVYTLFRIPVRQFTLRCGGNYM